jgi:hypothetical protein
LPEGIAPQISVRTRRAVEAQDAHEKLTVQGMFQDKRQAINGGWVDVAFKRCAYSEICN